MPSRALLHLKLLLVRRAFSNLLEHVRHVILFKGGHLVVSIIVVCARIHVEVNLLTYHWGPLGDLLDGLLNGLLLIRFQASNRVGHQVILIVAVVDQLRHLLHLIFIVVRDSRDRQRCAGSHA